jgi:hypothetical protein
MFQKNNPLKGANYLELIPLRIREHVIENSGKVTILVPKFTNRFIVRYFVPLLKSPHIRVKLDEFGSETWLEIDGKKNVDMIANRLVEKFGSRIEPVHERLTKFLTDLYKKGLISFKI